MLGMVDLALQEGISLLGLQNEVPRLCSCTQRGLLSPVLEAGSPNPRCQQAVPSEDQRGLFLASLLGL